MRKNKLISKLLLVTMLFSYVQPFAVGAVYAADEDFPEVENVVVEVGAEVVPPEDSEPVPEPTLPVPVVEVSIPVDGVLDYEIKNALVYDDDVTLEAYWTEADEACEWDDGVNLGKTYKPTESGDYKVTVTAVKVVDDQVLRSEPACSTYTVAFPEIQANQFAKSYRAGERLVAEYSDESIAEFIVLEDGITVTQLEEGWLVEGGILEVVGDYTFNAQVVDEYGFASKVTPIAYTVTYGELNAVESELSVEVNGSVAEYVRAGEGSLQVEFTARDVYRNSYENLSRVDVRLNGQLMEGTDLIGSNKYQVVRSISVPAGENYNSRITVDVFSDECEGILLGEENYCFSNSHAFVVYDENAVPVSNLVYTERTSERVVEISGEKIAGYGVKLNSVHGDYAVIPDQKTTFKVEVPLVEGLNEITLYGVKVVSESLVFYSDAVSLIIERDTKVTAPVWGAPAITLDGDYQATLHWTDPIYLTNVDYDFSHVNIYRSTVPNFVPNEYNLIVQTHNPSWTDSGLNAGANYYYIIEAVDDLGNTKVIDGVRATGDILGESAATEVEVWDVSIYGGKGEYVDEVESVTDEEEELTIKGDDKQEEDGEPERLKSGLSEWLDKAVSGVSSVFEKIVGNIFVQICLGGILIFISLMIIISFLVWAKEKIVDSSMVSSSVKQDEDMKRASEVSKSRKQMTKRNKKGKKSKTKR